MLRDMNRTCDNCMELKGRIIDAAFVFSGNRLVARTDPSWRLRERGEYSFYRRGIKVAEEAPKVKVMFYVGMPAFYAGSNVKVIDMLGLCDPLLSRLPVSKKRGFYIGHFRRDLPRGYEFAVETGSLSRMHPALAQYYDKLRIITDGNLWSWNRLKTIVYFNLGYYDHWKYDYLRSART